MALSISRHEGILNKHLCKNFFEENRMPVFLLRFECRRRSLNSNKESHWLQVLRINCWNITQVIWICQTFQQHISILSYSVVFIKNINVLSLRHRCFPENIPILKNNSISHWRGSGKKLFLKISQHSQENTCVGASLMSFESTLLK